MHLCTPIPSEKLFFELNADNTSPSSLARRTLHPWFTTKKSNLYSSDHRTIYHFETLNFKLALAFKFPWCISFLQSCSFLLHKMRVVWIVVMFISAVLLSFWRHPFIAEDPLVSMWWNATFLRICSHEEANSSTSLMAWGCVTAQQIFIYWVHYSFKKGS